MRHYKYDDFVEAVAKRLRALREERKFSQRSFAQQHGWDRVHWTRIEAGQKMSLETLIKAANSFDLSVEELISEAVRFEGPGVGSPGYKATQPQSREP